MLITEAGLPGVYVVAPQRHQDARGFFSEVFKQSALRAAGIQDAWVQDNHSYSRLAGTVRGFHFQAPPHAQAKLVRVTRGAVLDVALDLRHGSPTFGRHVAVRLDAEAGQQLYLPVGFAHGLCTLEPDTEVIYKVSREYAPSHDLGVRWDDPALGVAWPVSAEAAQLSEKDRRHPLLAELPRYFELSEAAS